jgi:hypothetical protein
MAPEARRDATSAPVVRGARPQARATVSGGKRTVSRGEIKSRVLPEKKNEGRRQPAYPPGFHDFVRGLRIVTSFLGRARGRAGRSGAD